MISAVITYDDGRVSIHDSAAKQVGTVFTPGFYEARTSDSKMIIKEGKLQELHTPYRTEENILIMNAVEAFFSEGVMEKIMSLGFVHKLGILQHGRQGTAKTALMHFIADKLRAERGAIVFFCTDNNSLSTASILSVMIREIQNNPIVLIADEFERYAKDGESQMKNFLDGNQSINNMLFLAATNYIKDVPETLRDRPSRFKIVVEVKGIKDKSLMSAVIRDISSKINPSLFTEREIADVVKGINDGITMDELKHICLDKATNMFITKGKNNVGTVGFLASLVKRDEDKKDDKVVWSWTWGKAAETKPSDSDSNI